MEFDIKEEPPETIENLNPPVDKEVSEIQKDESDERLRPTKDEINEVEYTVVYFFYICMIYFEKLNLCSWFIYINI